MSLVTWLLAGSLTGWATSYYLTNTSREAIVFNIVVGVLGAAFVGWVVAPMLGVPPGFGPSGFFVSASGAVALLFCVHFVQRAA